jgi:type IV pilus assembly protein PilE
MRRGAKGHQRGFTLIELMIAVMVIGILAAIAYPSYQDQVRKSRRGQAKADLVELGQQLERYHTVQNKYKDWTLPYSQSPRTGMAQYSIAISNQDINTYTLTATPSSGTKQNKDKCGVLTLNQAGVKGSGTSGATSNPDCF